MFLCSADTKDRLLQNNEDVRATLPRVVPGLNDKSFFGPKRPVEYEVRVVQISHASTASSSTTPNNISNRGPQIEAAALQNNEDVRAILQRVVPGLNDSSFFNGPKRLIEHEVRVVQVSHASTASSTTPTTTAITSSTTNNNSTNNSRGPQIIEAATSGSSSSNSATVVTNTAPTTSKVQYVYKQGGQTVLIGMYFLCRKF